MMGKVYLIGVIYDEDKINFETRFITHSIEIARIIKEKIALKEEVNIVEIREWDVDVLNPVANVERIPNTYVKDGIEIKTWLDKTYPYKVID